MGDPTFTQLIQQDLDVGRKGIRLHALVKVSLHLFSIKHDLVKRWQDAFSSIEDCDKPVIALVHGACIGAGLFPLKLSLSLSHALKGWI